jgi:hypothetical protein
MNDAELLELCEKAEDRPNEQRRYVYATVEVRDLGIAARTELPRLLREKQEAERRAERAKATLTRIATLGGMGFCSPSDGELMQAWAKAHLESVRLAALKETTNATTE